jgi:hypothetical protein
MLATTVARTGTAPTRRTTPATCQTSASARLAQLTSTSCATTPESCTTEGPLTEDFQAKKFNSKTVSVFALITLFEPSFSIVKFFLVWQQGLKLL